MKVVMSTKECLYWGVRKRVQRGVDCEVSVELFNLGWEIFVEIDGRLERIKRSITDTLGDRYA